MDFGETLLAHEPAIRLGAFLGIFAAVAAWETLSPRRRRVLPRLLRWTNNFAIVAVNSLLLRLVFPAAAVGFAWFAAERGLGLFHLLDLPPLLEGLLAFFLLDLAIWAQHLAFHKVPLFWRLHRMHHADLDFDVTTGARFHPIEILLSMAIKFAVVVALGAPPLAVLLFELALNATSMFNHANASLPSAIERVVRLFVVTPDMHRVHHSVIRRETDSNFGFNFPWWDRIFGTYRAQPELGHDGMSIGIESFRDAAEARLDRLLTQPFREA
ncbi:MAG: sterol desaturase family protein [Alphaproteobacteria bacterium]|nr:sterol desaturase family protein [Alphaproteobacteria bacterium]